MQEFNYATKELLPIADTKPVEEFLQHNLSGNVYHKTILNYLKLGYAKHYGIEIKPDFIWFTILNEISRIVKDDADAYREIFTDSNENKEISVPSMDAVKMPIESLLRELFNLIPSGLKEENVIIPFSTLTVGSRLAFGASFLEAASPYYSYSMYMCGYNKIRVLGTIADYEMIQQSLSEFKTIFALKPVMLGYLEKVSILTENIITGFNSSDFWKDIFYVEQCGSGHQEQVRGWFQDFFNDFDSLKYLYCYPIHIASIKYKNLSTGLSYKMSVGLFSSTIEDGYLIPNFEMGIVELKEEKEEENKEESLLSN